MASPQVRNGSGRWRHLDCRHPHFCNAATMSVSTPNIVLIVADNLGWGELGCYGGGAPRGAAPPQNHAPAPQGPPAIGAAGSAAGPDAARDHAGATVVGAGLCERALRQMAFGRCARAL